MSTGGQIYPYGRGFAFYYSIVDDLYCIVVLDKSWETEIRFAADFSSDFVLVRFLWIGYNQSNYFCSLLLYCYSTGPRQIHEYVEIQYD